MNRSSFRCPRCQCRPRLGGSRPPCGTPRVVPTQPTTVRALGARYGEYGATMSRKAQWPWWQQYTGQDDYRIRELLRAVLDLHGYFGDPATWVWRGQANAGFLLSPGVHTRVVRAGLELTDLNVADITRKLLDSTRAARLDVHEGAALPDFALLAQLQHHGAATPLLDVSLDPLVALYMAVVSPNVEDDEEDGVVFALRKPERVPGSDIEPFDTRPFEEIYQALPSDRTVFYRAPDVSDRLRIQRGYFLVSRVNPGTKVTIHASIDAEREHAWINRRMAERGRKGPQPPVTSDIAAFRVPSKFKRSLQSWLEERTGLSEDFVYPTVWHQPHQEAFAKSHSRVSATS